MNVLDEIVANKREEIAAAKAVQPLESLREKINAFKVVRRSFKQLFKKRGVIIAEIKPKSPSAGQLILHSPLEIADIYAKSEADAISVLTDEKYFGGSLTLLGEIRSRVPQAILRKDFIIDEYQIYESLLATADAYLLIANILSERELGTFIALGESMGIDALVEVHDAADLEKALAAGAQLLGINNRDLKSLKVDITTTEKLMRLMPHDVHVISESGIETVGEVRKVHAFGVRGILVGTSILRSTNPLEKIKELKEALV